MSVRCVSACEASRNQDKAVNVNAERRRLVVACIRVTHRVPFWIPLVLTGILACSGTPKIGEQEQLVRANKLVIDKITTRAVVNVWGKPAHHHTEFTQFFVMPDRSMIPRSRVASGEVPKG